MSAECNNSLSHTIALRAQALTSIRRFFEKRSIIEVDCFQLVQAPSVDLHIELFSTNDDLYGKRFLCSSPEYAMKRLLSAGAPDIYFLGHVWRLEPSGRYHSPEFLLAEWYRKGVSFQGMIEETIALVELFTGPKLHIFLSYQQAFMNATGLDPHTASLQELQAYVHNIPALLSYPIEKSSKDELLTLLMSYVVEPSFNPEAITALAYYPPSQAALAQTILHEGHTVAERFELYHNTLELANGYHELHSSTEQKKRFFEENQARIQAQKLPFPLDEPFIEAVDHLPDCCGVAVGVDRLCMLAHNATHIRDIQPLPWSTS